MEKELLIEGLAAALDHKKQLQLETLAKHAVTEFPDDAFGYSYLAEALALEVPARLPQAEVCLAKATDIEPKNVDYLIRFAELKDMQGKFEDAQIIWGKVLKVKPDHVHALLALGSYQIQFFQDYASGIEYLNKAIAIDPVQAECHLFRAEAHIGLQNYEAALEDVQKVLQNGFDEVAMLLKINALDLLGRGAETFLLYEKLIQHLPNDYTHTFNYGQVLFSAARFEDAVEQFEATIRHQEKEEPMYYFALGEAALYALQLDKAIEAFENVLQLDKDDDECTLLLIEATIAKKEYKAAIKLAKDLAKKSKDDQSTYERALIQEGVALLFNEEFDKAEAVFTPIAKKKGLRQPDAYYGLGMLYHQQGKNESAYQFMRAASRMNHPLAGKYIEINMQAYLETIKTTILAENAKNIAVNQESAFVKSIEHKLWRFADLESARLSGLTPAIVANVKESMASITMVVSPTGLLVLSGDGVEMTTYKIKKEAGSGAVLQVQPLDGAPAYKAIVKYKDGKITFSREDNEVMHLAVQDPKTAPQAVLENAKKYALPTTIAFLGKEAVALLTSLK